MGPDRSREVRTFEKPHSRRATLPEHVDDEAGAEGEEGAEEEEREIRHAVESIRWRRVDRSKFDM